MSVEINGLPQSASTAPATQAVTLAAGSAVVAAFVDGSDVTVGTQADAAATGITGSLSMMSVQKGMLKALLALTGGSQAETLASGADVTEGSTTDAPLAAAATGAAVTIMSVFKGLFNISLTGFGAIGTSTDAVQTAAASNAAAGTSIGLLKGLFNLFFAGTARVQASTSMWNLEYGSLTDYGPTVSTTANTNSSGVIRTNGTAGAPGPYAYYTAMASANVAGTLIVSNSIFTQSVAVPANGSATIKIPAMGNCACSFTCGSTAGKFDMASLLSAA